MQNNYSSLLFKPSFDLPCPCLKYLMIPADFNLKSLVITSCKKDYDFNGANCLRKIIYKALQGEKNLIIWLQDIPLFSTALFATQLEYSLILRRNYYNSPNYNLGDNFQCSTFINILIAEYLDFINKGLLSANKDKTKKNISTFYSDIYHNYLNSAFPTLYTEEDFFIYINPLLYYNIIYAHNIYKCFLFHNIDKIVVIVPYINSSIISYKIFDYTIDF